MDSEEMRNGLDSFKTIKTEESSCKENDSSDVAWTDENEKGDLSQQVLSGQQYDGSENTSALDRLVEEAASTAVTDKNANETENVIDEWMVSGSSEGVDIGQLIAEDSSSSEKSKDNSEQSKVISVTTSKENKIIGSVDVTEEQPHNIQVSGPAEPKVNGSDEANVSDSQKDDLLGAEEPQLNAVFSIQGSEEVGQSDKIPSLIYTTAAVTGQDGTATVEDSGGVQLIGGQYMVSNDPVYLARVGDNGSSFDGTVVGYQDENGQIHTGNMQIVEGMTEEELQQLQEQPDAPVMYRIITQTGSDQQNIETMLGGTAGRTIVRFQDEDGNTLTTGIMDVDEVQGIIDQSDPSMSASELLAGIPVSQVDESVAPAFSVETPISITTSMKSSGRGRPRKNPLKFQSISSLSTRESSNGRDDILRLKTVSGTPGKPSGRNESDDSGNVIKIRTITSSFEQKSSEAKTKIIVGNKSKDFEMSSGSTHKIIVGGRSRNQEVHSNESYTIDDSSKHKLVFGKKAENDSVVTPHRIIVGSSNQRVESVKSDQSMPMKIIVGSSKPKEPTLTDEKPTSHRILVGGKLIQPNKNKDSIKISFNTNDIIESRLSTADDIEKDLSKDDFVDSEKKDMKDINKRKEGTGPKIIYTGRKKPGRKPKNEEVSHKIIVGGKDGIGSKVVMSGKPKSFKDDNFKDSKTLNKIGIGSSKKNKTSSLLGRDNLFDDDDEEEDELFSDEDEDDYFDDDDEDFELNLGISKKAKKSDSTPPFMKKNIDIIDVIVGKRQPTQNIRKNALKAKRKYSFVIDNLTDEEESALKEMHRMKKEKIEMLKRIKREVERIRKKIG